MKIAQSFQVIAPPSVKINPVEQYTATIALLYLNPLLQNLKVLKVNQRQEISFKG